MELHFAKRMESFQPGIFNVLNDKKNELLKAGRTVYNLSVGTPDFLPDENVMRAMQEACKDPDNYKYSLGNLPELVEAVQNWYQRRYGVALDPEEIMSVNGSQEGIAHVALPLCDPGDVVLCPNPGYPIFEMGPWLCGAEIAYYDLHEENHYLPDLDAIPEDLAKRAKMMVVSYPLNPVCVAAPRSFYEKLIAFAKNAKGFRTFFYSGKILGIFSAFWIALVIWFIFNYIMSCTRTGRHIYATGSNIDAARLSGVNVDNTVIYVYIVAAFCACITGLITCASTGTGTMDAGTSYEMYAVAASVIGGVSTLGGSGILLGTVIGSGIWGVLQNGLQFAGAPVAIRNIVIGIIVVVAVLMDVIVRSGRGKSKKHKNN